MTIVAIYFVLVAVAILAEPIREQFMRPDKVEWTAEKPKKEVCK